MKEKVLQILMERDGLTRSEATEVFEECAEALQRGEYDAIAEYCELEDDYIFAFI